MPAALTLTIHTLGMDAHRAMADQVRLGLTQSPKELPCRYFYDDRGSALFEQITELPEYYLTRAETEILEARSDELATITRPQVIVELGAGACTKTRLLIESAHRGGSLRCFVPFDIGEGVLRASVSEISSEFGDLDVHGIVGDFASHLDAIPRLGRQLVMFLGSTIGNFEVAERRRLLASVRALLSEGDFFLLGVDLVKDERELVAAYADAQGVTAEFNRNLLNVLNRELEADFDVGSFEHVALWNAAASRMEMHLRAEGAQRVRVPGAGLPAPLEISFEDGETVRTEISVKFTRAVVERSFAEAGLDLRAWLTDSAQRFALALATAVPLRHHALDLAEGDQLDVPHREDLEVSADHHVRQPAAGDAKLARGFPKSQRLHVDVNSSSFTDCAPSQG
jgi:L-histidine N-alpha-methyltransferase